MRYQLEVFGGIQIGDLGNARKRRGVLFRIKKLIYVMVYFKV